MSGFVSAKSPLGRFGRPVSLLPRQQLYFSGEWIAAAATEIAGCCFWCAFEGR